MRKLINSEFSMALTFDLGTDIPHDYVVNIRWCLEGVFLLVIGSLGVIGEFNLAYAKNDLYFFIQVT